MISKCDVSNKPLQDKLELTLKQPENQFEKSFKIYQFNYNLIITLINAFFLVSCSGCDVHDKNVTTSLASCDADAGVPSEYSIVSLYNERAILNAPPGKYGLKCCPSPSLTPAGGSKYPVKIENT